MTLMQCRFVCTQVRAAQSMRMLLCSSLYLCLPYANHNAVSCCTRLLAWLFATSQRLRGSPSQDGAPTLQRCIRKLDLRHACFRTASFALFLLAWSTTSPFRSIAHIIICRPFAFWSFAILASRWCAQHWYAFTVQLIIASLSACLYCFRLEDCGMGCR